MRRGYLPIQDYGIIGDMHSIALIGKNGSLDWCCLPSFDSPSIFGAILDDSSGGYFQITPASEWSTHRQFYWPETNVLVTRFLSSDGISEIIDYMAVGESRAMYGHSIIIRTVKAVQGAVSFKLACLPAFNYARDAHTVHIHEDGAVFEGPDKRLALTSNVALKLEKGNGHSGVESDFTVEEGNVITFALRLLDENTQTFSFTQEEAQATLDNTISFWRRWLSQCTYKGRWREMVHRSALTLKLLTYEPTGAIVAAPTCSLPETIGGSRNWDYRYTWIRDAAFTLYGLLRIGFTEEAAKFIDYLSKLCAEENETTWPLQVMYGIDGRNTLIEETLDHLDGYKGSRPVRIGNGAYDQLQLDIYGELMDAVYIYNKYGEPIAYDLWKSLRRFVDWVCDNWHLKDEGVWEVRGGRQHFTYSKLMCWVAVDRGLRLAEKRSFPADRRRWLSVRDEIYEDIMARGWNAERQAFVQHYESTTLDAANLIMPLVFFMSPVDPRMLKTLDAIMHSPTQGGLFSNNLVYRYNVAETHDGLGSEEGAFNICTFWLVEALTRASIKDHSRLEQARLIFEDMLRHGNHLGLFAEESDHKSGALGNYPQAFTHLSLISAAYNLNRILENH